MKKIYLISSGVLLSLLLGSGCLFSSSKGVKTAKADTTTDMDSIAVESGEELDTANMIYDDFSTGLSMSTWAVSKKAWGNSTVSYNSGVIPQNVMYNSTDKTVVFRALGDYYKDNDVDYDLQSRYGYAHDGSTGAGRVYSIDGTRTGGCIKTREAYGPGRYEAKFKAAPIEGVCTAFWTFNYGDSETNYNEMDFELPTYVSESDKDDLSFNRIICTTYKTEAKYKSQRVNNLVYLNDNQYHTYCLEWYYSGRTKLVKWFIDGVLIASCNDATKISDNVGRVTLGVWIPGRSNFCGIPNFDKAYMELDYFKYTPFKNQTYVTTCDSLGSYVNTFETITETPKAEFVPQGAFNYGISDNFVTTGDVVESKSYDYASSPSSFGVKISGAGNPGVSTLEYTNPNIRGINKLELSFKYKGYGSARASANETNILSTGTLASRSEWTEFKQVLNIPNGNKTLTIDLDSESYDFGFYVDNISLTYPENEPDPVVNSISYSFFAKNNGQTSPDSWSEAVVYPDGNASHPWKSTKCKYNTREKYGFQTFELSMNNILMTSSSGYYFPIKECLISNALFAVGDNTALLTMMFDIDNFKDVELSMASYSGTDGRYIHTLYSLDSGTSWNLLNTTSCSSLTGQAGSDIFKKNLRIEATGGLIGRTIRLAFVANQGANTDPYLVNSVIINNYQEFKTRLDGPLCSADNDTKLFLDHQYRNLTSSELTALNSETMESYPQTYAEGYSFLQSYWSIGGMGLNKTAISQEESIYLVVFIAVIVQIFVLGFVLVKRERNKD